MNSKISRDNLREEARKLYKTFPSPFWVKSLNQYIIFNSQGFNHLLYDGRGRKRPVRDERHKLLLVPFIIEVLMRGTLTKYRKQVKQSKNVEYWGISASLPNLESSKIKVVIKRAENGRILFWSVM